VVGAWRDLADRLEAAESWGVAREAWARVMTAARDPIAGRRAAASALAVGDAAGALALLDQTASLGGDPNDPDLLAVRVRALAALGRAADAERLVGGARSLGAGDRARLAEALAQAWVAAGDVARARAALAAAGPGVADSSAAAGWLALYSGDLRTARVLLRRPPEASGGAGQGEAALVALAVLSRVRADSAPGVGRAFVALARADTAGAARAFVDAAAGTSEAAPLLLLTAARLHAARGEGEPALALWRRVVEQHPTAPEAPEADLAWARALVRAGAKADARARLEHLIVTYPESALVPIARRELEAP
jgi:hypothetical protein